MAGEAEVKLKFISDEKALATMEKRLETLTNKLDQMAAAGKRAGQTKVDPIAGKMAGGSTGIDPMIAKLNAHTAGIKQAAAAESEYKSNLLQRLSAMRESDASRASFSRKAQLRELTGADRLSQAPAIMQTRGVIAQVRAQQAAREAAARTAEELAKQPGAIEMAGGAALRYLGPLALAATAVKLIGNEWNNVIDRQQKAGQTAVSFEAALGEATLNVGGVYGPEKIRQKALEMSAKTGVDPAKAVQAISLAIKSGGATNEAEADRLVTAAEVAAALLPNTEPKMLSGTAGAIASTMARTGATAQQAAGTVLSMHQKSNVEDPAKGISMMSPVLANMLAQGASEKLSQALAPALSQAIEDTQGDESNYAAVAFTTSLTKAFGSQFNGQKNIPDLAIEAMRADPEVARQFFAGEMVDPLTEKAIGKPELGRGKAETFFRAIAGDKTLSGDDTVIASYRHQLDEFMASSRTMEESGKFYNERLEQVQSATPRLQSQRTLSSATEQMRIEGSDAMRGITREGLNELLQTAGMPDARRKLALGSFDLRKQAALDETIQALKEEAASQRGAFPMGGGIGAFFDRYRSLAPVTDENKANAEKLERAAAALEQIAQRNAQRPFDRKGNVENVETN